MSDWLKKLFIDEAKAALESRGGSSGGSGKDRLKYILNHAPRAANFLFNDYDGESVDELITYSDTENSTETEYMFTDAKALKTIPQINTSNVTSMSCMFLNCRSLIEIPPLDTSKVTRLYMAFKNCYSLTTISLSDVRNVSSYYEAFYYCQNLTNLTLKNISDTLTIGSGTTYGHKLTLDSLINTVKELVNVGSAKTLTMGSANLEKIANVYVKLTGEAEEVEGLTKVPCEVCESTDEGAMAITDYALEKGWTLA